MASQKQLTKCPKFQPPSVVIDNCLKCYSTCLTRAMNHCLEVGGEHTEPQHFRLICTKLSGGSTRHACDMTRSASQARHGMRLAMASLAVLGPASTRPRRRRLGRVALVGARHLSFSPRRFGVGDCGGRGRRKDNAGRGGMFLGRRSRKPPSTPHEPHRHSWSQSQGRRSGQAMPTAKRRP